MGLPFSVYELGAFVGSRFSWGARLVMGALLLVRLADRVPFSTGPEAEMRSAFKARATVGLTLGLVLVI